MLAVVQSGRHPCLLAHFHGRLQRLQVLPSLRSVLQRPLPPPGASFSAAATSPAAAAGPRASKVQGRRPRPHRCCLALQQLHAEAGTAGAGAAPAPAAAPTCRLILPGEVHIWWLDPRTVTGDQELQRCRDLLTERELADCSTSQEAAVRRERLLARALVRSVLAGYLVGRPDPRSLVFDRNPHGKPRLVRPNATPAGHKLRFNLAHTSSMIGLAVTVEGLVGLDVEGMERRTRGEPMRLARRRFSQQEIEDMQARQDEESKALYFLQLWTLKEAYVKALGRGISAPPGLRSFSFRLDGAAAQQRCEASWQQDAQQQQQRRQQRQRQRQWEGQEQRPPNVPEQMLVEPEGNSSGASSWRGIDISRGSSSSSGGSRSSLSGSLDFVSGVPEQRRWQFALLQPAPGLMAALCVQRRCQDSNCSSCGAPDDPLTESELSDVEAQPPPCEAQPVRLLSFQATPWSVEEAWVEPNVIAIGQHPA